MSRTLLITAEQSRERTIKAVGMYAYRGFDFFSNSLRRKVEFVSTFVRSEEISVAAVAVEKWTICRHTFAFMLCVQMVNCKLNIKNVNILLISLQINYWKMLHWHIMLRRLAHEQTTQQFTFETYVRRPGLMCSVPRCLRGDRNDNLVILDSMGHFIII